MLIQDITQLVATDNAEIFVDSYEHSKKINIIFRNTNPTQKELDSYKRRLKTIVPPGELIAIEQKLSTGSKGQYKRIIVTIVKD